MPLTCLPVRCWASPSACRYSSAEHRATPQPNKKTGGISLRLVFLLRNCGRLLGQFAAHSSDRPDQAASHQQHRAGLRYRAGRPDHDIPRGSCGLPSAKVSRRIRLALQTNATEGSVTIVVVAVVNTDPVLEQEISVVGAAEIEKK